MWPGEEKFNECVKVSYSSCSVSSARKTIIVLFVALIILDAAAWPFVRIHLQNVALYSHTLLKLKISVKSKLFFGTPDTSCTARYLLKKHSQFRRETRIFSSFTKITRKTHYTYYKTKKILKAKVLIRNCNEIHSRIGRIFLVIKKNFVEISRLRRSRRSFRTEILVISFGTKKGRSPIHFNLAIPYQCAMNGDHSGDVIVEICTLIYRNF